MLKPVPAVLYIVIGACHGPGSRKLTRGSAVNGFAFVNAKILPGKDGFERFLERVWPRVLCKSAEQAGNGDVTESAPLWVRSLTDRFGSYAS